LSRSCPSLHADPGGFDAIAAEHDRVAFLDLELVREGLDRLPHTDRAREAVFERMSGGLLGLDHPEAHLLGRP